MVTITLFTRTGCGLCDEVKAELEMLADAFPHQLNEVDITRDAALFGRYRHAIPVLHIGKTELRAPIARTMLVEALRAAT